MKKPSRIGYLIPEFPGQTHSFFWREIKALETYHGYSTKIISTRQPPQKVTHEWVSEAEAEYLFPPPWQSFPFLILGFLRRIGRVLTQSDVRALLRYPHNWGLLLMAIRLGQICRRDGIMHLHVHSCANFALIAALCDRMYNLPYSIVLHGPLKDYGPNQNFKWQRARFAFVITEKLRREMAELLPATASRIQIAPMGVDTDVFTPRPGRSKTQGPFRWFCCARLNRVKGFDTLLSALDDIRRSHPNLSWHLTIAGEDELGGHGYRKILEERLAVLGLTKYVTLLGAITQSKVLNQLQDSDGFVLASLQEPLGVAYMEAMACGLPTIGTNAGGVPELIRNECDGLLVQPENPTELAEAMLRIMTNPQLRAKLSRNGRTRIVNQFGARRSADVLAQALLYAT